MQLGVVISSQFLNAVITKVTKLVPQTLPWQ
jgi:hypothetical protein